MEQRALTVVGDEGLVLLQLVGTLQVGKQALGGLRVAPHRGGRFRSAASGLDRREMEVAAGRWGFGGGGLVLV